LQHSTIIDKNMALSLREQLLNAGLVTQAQIEQANQPKPKHTSKPQAKGKNPAKQQQSAPADAQHSAKPASKKPAKPVSDLALFYQERDQLERAERAEQERRARELAARKKQTREAVRALLSDNVQNVEEADIRYNFMVGDNIKYLYVTEQQQQQLAAGELAITFMEGKRCLISHEIAQQLLALDPSKLVILNSGDESVMD
jgi:hypothetical protein